MNPSIEKWKTWLEEHPINIMTKDADTLVEELYWNYAECNPPISNRTQALNEQMRPYLVRLNTREQDALFALFCDLFTEQDKLAFVGGLRFGMTLILDLLE